MWVICCGMPRAGSTVQYLLAKDIVEETGRGRAVGFVKKDEFEEIYLSNQNQAEYIVLKSHQFLPEVLPLFEREEAAAVYVFRDMRDAVLSRIRKLGIDFDYGKVRSIIDRNLRSYSQWNRLSPILVSRYETMVADLKGEALRISRHLEIAISDDFASELARRYSLEEQKKRIQRIDYDREDIFRTAAGALVDQETQLHANHIRSGNPEQWRQDLSSLQVAFIEAQAYDWLVEHGYPISKNWLLRKLAVHAARKQSAGR